MAVEILEVVEDAAGAAECSTALPSELLLPLQDAEEAAVAGAEVLLLLLLSDVVALEAELLLFAPPTP